MGIINQLTNHNQKPATAHQPTSPDALYGLSGGSIEGRGRPFSLCQPRPSILEQVSHSVPACFRSLLPLGRDCSKVLSDLTILTTVFALSHDYIGHRRLRLEWG